MDHFSLLQFVEGVLIAGSQQAPAAGDKPQGPGGQYMLIMFALIGLAFYFIVLRPQKKEQAARQKKIDTLKKGDKIVTIGGLHGIVHSMDKEKGIVSVEVDKDVRLQFTRSAIQTVIMDDKESKKLP